MMMELNEVDEQNMGGHVHSSGTRLMNRSSIPDWYFNLIFIQFIRAVTGNAETARRNCGERSRKKF